MKKTVAILFLLILAICSSFGQEINPELQKEKFNTRAHQQQKTGWILLGIGTAVTTIGVVAYYAENRITSYNVCYTKLLRQLLPYTPL